MFFHQNNLRSFTMNIEHVLCSPPSSYKWQTRKFHPNRCHTTVMRRKHLLSIIIIDYHHHHHHCIHYFGPRHFHFSLIHSIHPPIHSFVWSQACAARVHRDRMSEEDENNNIIRLNRIRFGICVDVSSCVSIVSNTAHAHSLNCYSNR